MGMDPNVLPARYDEINSTDKKQKVLTGHLALDIRKLGEKEELPNRIDTALLPVKPFTQTERDPAAVRHHAVRIASYLRFPSSRARSTTLATRRSTTCLTLICSSSTLRPSRSSPLPPT